jgi:hypothetical protein
MDDDNHPLHTAPSRPYSVASQRDLEYDHSAYDEAEAADPEELLGSEYSGSQYAEEEARVDFEPSMVSPQQLVDLDYRRPARLCSGPCIHMIHSGVPKKCDYRPTMQSHNQHDHSSNSGRPG